MAKSPNQNFSSSPSIFFDLLRLLTALIHRRPALSIAGNLFPSIVVPAISQILDLGLNPKFLPFFDFWRVPPTRSAPVVCSDSGRCVDHRRLRPRATSSLRFRQRRR